MSAENGKNGFDPSGARQFAKDRRDYLLGVIKIRASSRLSKPDVYFDFVKECGEVDAAIREDEAGNPVPLALYAYGKAREMVRKKMFEDGIPLLDSAMALTTNGHHNGHGPKADLDK